MNARELADDFDEVGFGVARREGEEEWLDCRTALEAAARGELNEGDVRAVRARVVAEGSAEVVERVLRVGSEEEGGGEVEGERKSDVVAAVAEPVGVGGKEGGGDEGGGEIDTVKKLSQEELKRGE